MDHLTFRVASKADTPAVLDLLRELSPSAEGLGQATIRGRLGDERILVVLAELGDQLVGMATLTTFTTLADGLVGRVEDVIVSEAARGHGAGRGLMLTLHHEAERLGVSYLELTSRPSREAANQLYQSLGYDQRETNVYRRTL